MGHDLDCRAEIEARALVTARIRPLYIDNRTVHQIGLPFQWGYKGVVKGDIANDLTLIVADRNVSMHEAKSFACNMRAGRRDHSITHPTGGSDISRTATNIAITPPEPQQRPIK